ncbi:putative sulfate exporter family transporter [Entomospira nematocerorum]|uniref:Sulfate exporter family transporter n=1 Tax=Entomospira nematocerorum TaxID=2719987 RepID=A0A968GB35_9SPIO|nr:putative sulfate exporter family transporter [Entomospira nematocera]NIZ46529.1 putative sulfate exporter family transporter [Entomospira nematocera]WDI33672.1 putative sulfate exporter family transporter [Entomospira nematocera]
MNSFIHASAGIILSIVVACLSFLLSRVIPSLGAATIAIIIGIVMRNTIVKQSLFSYGTKFVEGKFLEVAVMLLGANITLYTIQELGLNGILFIIISIFTTIYVYISLGKFLHIPLSIKLLMAGGNAVCGSSAVASIAPIINAKEEHKGQVITIVNLVGTFWMLVLPLIAQFLYRDNPIQMAALLGGTLPSVGQVTAASHLISSSLVQDAMLFKIVRISMIVCVVIVMRTYYQKSYSHSNNISPKSSSRVLLPWYIIAFMLLCILNTLQLIPELIRYFFTSLQNWLEVIALAAIGLRLDLHKFIQSGFALLWYAIITSLTQISLVIVFLHFMIK